MSDSVAILVTGGDTSTGANASAELYDPVSDTWSPATSMSTGRYYQTATRLASGKVLVTGGYTNSELSSGAELYDPVEDQDGDGSPDSTDNCPAVANPGQDDADHDGIGAACDPVELPKTKDECKHDGWKRFYNGAARFKNQGDCVSFVATHGRNHPAG